MTQKKLSQIEKIRYIRPILRDLNNQIEQYYSSGKNLFPLFRAISAHIYINFRDNIDPNSHTPIRIKNQLSMNTKMRKLESQLISSILKTDCTEDSINQEVSKMLDKILQDIFGLTLVLHTSNNIEKNYAKSEDPQIQMLLKQSKTAKQYLDFKPDNLKDSHTTFDISPTFIDNSDIGIQNRAPKELPPLDIAKIETWEDYYTNLISLLTLLTNLSTPCNYSSDGKKHNYCVSQINFPYLKVLEFDGVIDSNDKLKSIKNLLNIAENTYNGKFIPFDEQFDFAQKSQKQSIQSGSYHNKIDPQSLLNCKIQLQYLKDNLESLLNDRLSQYVLENEAPIILENMSQELKSIGLDLHKISSYKKARSNGYISSYIVAEFEKKFRFEIQLITEFRYIMGKEGNSAHNATRKNKKIDIFELFTSKDPSLDKEDLQILLKFLNLIDYKDITSYRTKPEDQNARMVLRELVDYALEQIKLVDYIELKNDNVTTSQISFVEYINSLLRKKAPNQGKISAAHNIVPNEARFTLDDDIQLLQKLISSRFHSVLSHYLIQEYQDLDNIHFRNERTSMIFSPGNISKDINTVLEKLNSTFPQVVLPKFSNIKKTTEDNLR